MLNLGKVAHGYTVPAANWTGSRARITGRVMRAVCFRYPL